MAVKTKLSRKEIERVLKKYLLGNLRESKNLSLGAVQTNIFIKTEKGKFVLRIYENRSKKYAEFEANLLEYLNGGKYPCPKPIKDKRGNFVNTLNKKPLAIFTFLEGKHKKKPNPKIIVSKIAELHNLTKDYKPKNANVRDSYDEKSSWKNAKINAKKIKPKKESKERLSWLKKELTKIQMPKSLPKGICHCDTHYSNFLYKNEKITAVLDFDDASYIPFIYDIANIVYFWAWPNKGNLNLNKTKELVKEYEKKRKLTQEEKEHLFDFLKMVILMSIGWFIHENNDFKNEKRKIELLNSIGRKMFYEKIF